MTAPKSLTRKVGPAPLWAWLVVALVGVYLVHRHAQSASAATQATGVPVTADTAGYSSGATGSTSAPLDGSGNDLLSALTANTDALTALQSAVGGGGYGAASGAGASGSGSNTAAVTAPTVNSGTNNAPAPVTQANAYDPAQAAAAAALGVSAQPNMTADQLNAQLADQGQPAQSYPSTIQPAPVPMTIGGPSQIAPPVASPTPTLVQPAPVDTSHVVSGGGGGRVPLAV